MPQTVTGSPFSATKTDSHSETLSDGNQIQDSRTEKIYRDSDGRMRSEATMTTPSGATHTMITIFDPVAGFVAHLNPADSTAVKQPLPPAPPKGERNGPPSDGPQVTKTDLGSQSISGVTATGTSITHTVPAGARGNSQPLVDTREVWVSTALQIPVKVSSSDPMHGNSTMIMSNIVQGAQDPTLFQIPSGYTLKDAPEHGPGGGPHGPPPPPGGSL
jgi:hypothetical protein